MSDKSNKKCTVPRCDRLLRCRGMCTAHYDRLRDRGDVFAHIPIGIAPGSRYLWQKGPIRFSAAHRRVVALWGKAASYRCIQCGGPAREWAYDGTDPEECLSLDGQSKGSRYSVYPEFYMPMCAKCHRTRDADIAKRELLEYRAWKLRTGLTLADVG